MTMKDSANNGRRDGLTLKILERNGNAEVNRCESWLKDGMVGQSWVAFEGSLKEETRETQEKEMKLTELLLWPR